MSIRSGASVCQDFALRSVPRGARTGRAPGRVMAAPGFGGVGRIMGEIQDTILAPGPSRGPEQPLSGIPDSPPGQLVTPRSRRVISAAAARTAASQRAASSVPSRGIGYVRATEAAG